MPPDPSPPAAPTALVVNDDDASRYVLARLLKGAGYRVVEAATGQEGLALARAGVDVVVLDVKLPDLDGLEVCRRLKADPGTSSLPVLQTSAAYISPSQRARGLDSGADGYLVQPCEPAELLATLSALLRARRAEDAARRLASEWQATFDAIGDGVALIDAEGRLRRANRALAGLLGTTADDLEGRPQAEALAPTFGAHTLQGLLAAGRREVVEAEARGRWYRLVADPVGAGGAEGRVVVVSDITDRRRLEDELRARASALAEADRRKDEFLAMLAHELRNPLGAMSAAMGVQEAMEEDAGHAPVRDMLRRQLRHLARLVDDLLDVSRITHGKIELRREVADLAEILRRALAASAPLLEARGARLEVVLPEEAVPVEADALRIEQVVVNLIGNAAKFSALGSTVRVSLQAAPEGRAALLRVADEGIGIAPGMLDSIFEMFVQADQSAARTSGGLGIGLTMVKKLVEMHGGTVRAESGGEGRGAVFSVRLPLADSPLLPRAAAPAPARAARARRVLLVEDNPDISDLIRMQAEFWGHEVRVAHDGPSGLEAILAWRPDLALVDVGLPGMDGYELARRVRAAAESPAVRLVAMTGYGRPEDRARALDAGFDAHLVKPVEPERLEEVFAASPLAPA